jgi:mRNA-degrading endonuclease toxin of MazEF toxin-antitoxin module
MIKENWVYRRGDIYYADLSQYLGSEQGGIRPVVVIQNNRGNYYAPTLIVATVTSRADKKLSQPTHVLIGKNKAFVKPSVVQLEQLFTIDKQRVQRYLGKMAEKEVAAIDGALMISLSLTARRKR